MAVPHPDIQAIDSDGDIRNLPRIGQYTFIVDGELAVGDDQTPYLVALEDCIVYEAHARVKTGPTVSAITMQIERSDDNEASWDEVVAPADFQIAAGAKWGENTGLSFALTKNDILRLNVDAIGAGVAGSDLSVFLRVKS